jgi:hypothetical protein
VDDGKKREEGEERTTKGAIKRGRQRGNVNWGRQYCGTYA